MADVFTLQVPRVCRIRETYATESDPPPSETEAFRNDFDHVVFGCGQQDGGVHARPEDLVESGALVVLGEPGAGKTSVLKQITTHLDAWIAAVRADDLPHLHSFANGLERDHAAVLNGLTLPFSSGAVEGKVCKIKFLKRLMFGRANYDLLRKMALLN